jgi:hypothetical protein|tara:strand:+ start:1309 stop:1542 length:234 start_codon:yes stop_codon:yes gene_type:complete
MAIDYRESVDKLNELLAKSKGHPIDIGLIVETLISGDIDRELKDLVKLALDSNEDHITMREIAEGVFNLFSWREENC